MKMVIKMKKWYKGDTHLHTTNSDGNMSVETMISECKKMPTLFWAFTNPIYIDE